MGQGFRVKARLVCRLNAMPKKVANLLHLLHAPVVGQTSIAGWIERFSLNRINFADNWPAVLWEYQARVYNRLADSLEKKQSD